MGILNGSNINKEHMGDDFFFVFDTYIYDYKMSRRLNFFVA